MSLSRTDFEYVRSLVRDQAAIVLDDNKDYLVEMRLSALAGEQGIEGVDELIRRSRDLAGASLKDLMVEAMTTNETSFFRDRHPFDAMREQVLPELIRARGAQRELKVWCAAASTGQEPYSLAMTLREALPDLSSWRAKILGTDISPQVLEKAASGVYSQHEVGRGLPATSLVKYFSRDGLNWVVKDELRRMCDFRELNLIQPWGALGTFDVIFIRNVLIYFDTDVKQQILAAARRHLAPDGYLFLGGSETLLGLDLDYARVNLGNVSAYQLGS